MAVSGAVVASVPFAGSQTPSSAPPARGVAPSGPGAPPAATRLPGQFLTGPNTGAPIDIALAYLRSRSSETGLIASDFTDVVVTSSYADPGTGVTHVYLRQRYRGIEIPDANASVNIARDGSVITAATTFVPGIEGRVNSLDPSREAAQGVADAAASVGLRAPSVLTPRRVSAARDKETEFDGGSLSSDPIPAKLVYVLQGKQLRLAWSVRINEPDGEHWWEIAVDAADGELLASSDYVDNETSTHNVYPLPLASPADGTRSVVVNPADAIASPFGWNDTDGAAGAESTLTSGNNVKAATDIDANNVPDAGSQPDGGASLDFNLPVDLTQAPSTYRPFSVSNLYYWNNAIHDVLYGYGFTEAAGNFQSNNYGRGGTGNDAVNADTQDGSGTNNANFATPADGLAPRMQMFVFTASTPHRDSSLDAEIVVHEYAHGLSNRLTGGPANVNCLNNAEQMGEGWSDYVGLLLTTNGQQIQTRGIATYALGQPPTGPGIRPTRYSPDLTINPSSYDTIKTAAVPHGVGYVWATMLWDLTWALVADHGYNADIRQPWNTGGNNLAMQLVIDGMKLQPCSPGFVDGRNAILAADVARTGGVNACTIWRSFARRGLGAGALQGSSASRSDGTQDFAVPAGTCPGPLPDLEVTGTTASPQTLGQPQSVVYTVTNIGDGTAPFVSFTIAPNTNVAFMGASSPSGTCSVATGRVTCSFASLPSDAAATVTVTIVPIDAGATNLEASASLFGTEVALDNNSWNIAISPTGTASGPTNYDEETNCAIVDVATVDCPLVVGGAGTALRVAVRVRLNHTYNSDLRITAVAPDGTTVLLADRRGASGDNYGTGADPCSGATVHSTFIDTAPTAISAGASPFAGSFRPESPLATLAGRSIAGTWKLRIADVEAPDAGTLLCWGVTVTTAEAPTTTTSTSTTSTTSTTTSTSTTSTTTSTSTTSTTTSTSTTSTTTSTSTSVPTTTTTTEPTTTTTEPTTTTTSTSTTVPTTTTTSTSTTVPTTTTTSTSTTVPTTTTTTSPATTTTTPTPTAGERLYLASVVPPSSIAIGAQNAIETAQRVNFSCAGTVNGLWWYRTAADTGPSTVTVWRNGTKVGEGVGSPSATGWVYVAFAAPVNVVPGQQLLAGVHRPNGAYAYRLNGFTNRSVTSPSGCMSSPASSSAARHGLYSYSQTPVVPTLSYLDSEYFISPEFVTGPVVTTTTLPTTTTTAPAPTTTTSPATTTTTPGTTTTGPTTSTTTPPAGNERLYRPTVTPPSSIAIGSTYAIETAQVVNFTCAGSVNGLWFYRTAADTGPHTATVWRNGTKVGEGVGSPSATGWVYVALAAPVTVGIGDQLLAGIHHPNGAYAYALNGFTGRSVSSACMVSPASASGALNGRYAYSTTPVLPGLGYLNSEYFISPDFVADTSIPTTTTTTVPAPPGGERLYPNSAVPASSLALGPTFAIQTAQRINFSCAGAVAGVWWYRIAADTGPNTVSMWRNGSKVGEGSAAPARSVGGPPAPNATGWVYVAFTSPVSVSAGDQVLVGVHHPNGAYGYTLNGFTNRSVISSSRCMTAPSDRTGSRNGLYAYTPSAATLPTLSYLASEYFVSPEFSG